MANCVVSTGNNAGVNIRASKSTGSTKLGVIANGKIVNIVRCDDTWATLLYNGNPAFAQHQYLSNPPTVNGDGLSKNDHAVCNANKVNIRSAAGGATTGKQMSKGKNVTIQDKLLTNNYYWYQIAAGQWVRGDFLTPGGNGAQDNTAENIKVGDAIRTTDVAVNFRSTPGGTVIRPVNRGTTMVVIAIASSGGYTWYKGVISNQTGYLRGDFVEKYKDGGDDSESSPSTVQAGHYVKMNQSNSKPVNVRASTSTGSKCLGKLQKETLMYCEEVVDATWVKIRWGGRTQDYAYIQSQYLADGGAAASNLKQRAIDIANSMAGHNYPNEPTNLDLGGGAWCVRYASFLLKAAGCSAGNYVPFENALVSEAVAYFQDRNAFRLRASGGVPSKGDWVFFSQGGETYQHVGFIVDVNGAMIKTVEGNLSQTISSRGPQNYNDAFGAMTVYGFGTPTWA